MSMRALALLITSIAMVTSCAFAPASATTFMGFGDLPGGDFSSCAYAVTPDGSAVAGWVSTSTSQSGYANTEAFHWTAGGGMTGLGYLHGHQAGTASSWANGISADGSTVVGVENNSSEAFRWTASGGMAGLGYWTGCDYSEAKSVSADGSVVVGYSYLTGRTGTQAFRWTASDGMAGLGDGIARGVSDDGSVVVGGGTGGAFRWTAAGGRVLLGDLAGGTVKSNAYAVSADGSVVAGTSNSALGDEPFRWTAGGGVGGLGILPGSQSNVVRAISADGSVVVGQCWVGSRYQSFIWTPGLGMQNIETLLGSALPTGWKLKGANGVALNGGIVTVVGEGSDPANYQEGWMATFAIPEPGSLFTLGSGLLGLAASVRRRRRGRQ
jgi:probable HAF family extracellular repeat protein